MAGAATRYSMDCATVVDPLLSQLLNTTLPYNLGNCCNYDVPNNRVSCDAQGRITKLNLTGMGLTGAIPQSLGCLERLRELDLSGNSLEGAIPFSLLAPPLEVLLLSDNPLLTSLPGSSADDLPRLSGLKECKVSATCVPQTGTALPEACYDKGTIVEVCPEGTYSSVPVTKCPNSKIIFPFPQPIEDEIKFPVLNVTFVPPKSSTEDGATQWLKWTFIVGGILLILLCIGAVAMMLVLRKRRKQRMEKVRSHAKEVLGGGKDELGFWGWDRTFPQEHEFGLTRDGQPANNSGSELQPAPIDPEAGIIPILAPRTDPNNVSRSISSHPPSPISSTRSNKTSRRKSAAVIQSIADAGGRRGRWSQTPSLSETVVRLRNLSLTPDKSGGVRKLPGSPRSSLQPSSLGMGRGESNGSSAAGIGVPVVTPHGSPVPPQKANPAFLATEPVLVPLRRVFPDRHSWDGGSGLEEPSATMFQSVSVSRYTPPPRSISTDDSSRPSMNLQSENVYNAMVATYTDVWAKRMGRIYSLPPAPLPSDTASMKLDGGERSIRTSRTSNSSNPWPNNWVPKIPSLDLPGAEMNSLLNKSQRSGKTTSHRTQKTIKDEANDRDYITAVSSMLQNDPQHAFSEDDGYTTISRRSRPRRTSPLLAGRRRSSSLVLFRTGDQKSVYMDLTAGVAPSSGLEAGSSGSSSRSSRKTKTTSGSSGNSSGSKGTRGFVGAFDSPTTSWGKVEAVETAPSTGGPEGSFVLSQISID
ncbi:hypothetical protein HDU97_005954 [Phlyctochytrium planicorne]|nr:hypothetical protein HDU97_005954 [Phlyctochytrium planicorne]